MKVQELRELLAKASGDDEVVLARDAEGNGYENLYEVDTERRIRTADEPEPYYRELTAEMREQGYTEEDVLTEGVDAVVLSP